jgi:hypothetical protein
MTAINYIRAEMAAQNIASLCAMMRAYRIAQDAASEDYTQGRLAEYLDQLNEALVGKDDDA